MGRRSARTLLTCFLLLPLLPRGTAAQLPADASWRTLESARFRVTYENGLQPLAERAVTSAERAHAALSTLVARPPAGRIDIVVSDNIDLSNGYATPFPSNRIVIYAKPPVDVLELQYMADWIDLVIIHELAHIFHLDVAGGLGRAIRTVFGRVPFSWPIFPAVFTPTWSVEGLATAVESAVTGYGRVHGSYHEMVVRTAALSNTLDDIDRLGSASQQWPGPSRAYIYGSLFMEYLTREYGADAVPRIVAGTADAFIPPALWFGRVGERVLGVTFRQAYEAWQRQLRTQASTLAATLASQGLTEGEVLTTHRAFALHPRYSPDGASIAYAASDQREPPQLRILDAATGAERWSQRVNTLSALSWRADGSVLASDVEFIDRFRIFSDLYAANKGERRRMTYGSRLQDADAARDGLRAVAIENARGTNRIVIVDVRSGAVRAVTEFDDDVHWALPRFSPDGARIAAGRWRRGGNYDVVVLDTLGRTLIQVTDEPGISTAPAWSHDGHWLLFGSDRTAIPNLYAAEIGMMGGDAAGGRLEPAPVRPRMRQVTNVLTGAFHPDVSPDGRWIVYTAYHDDGFRIERLPFDTAQWREPLPAEHSAIAAARGTHRHDTQEHEQLAHVHAAAAAADTTSRGPQRYRALRHMRPYAWVPVFDTGSQPGDFFGLWTFGSDLVGRHGWNAEFLLAPRSGRTSGAVSYTYGGLPAGFVHPTLTLAADRDWDGIFGDSARAIDEREDRAFATLALSTARWRSSGRLAITGELVRRSRAMYGFAPESPAGRFLGPADRLHGLRLATSYAAYVRPAFAISPENGVSISLGARQRWDSDPRSIPTNEGVVERDLGYRELTAWSAGYIALPLPGFARHVFAVRASGLFRDGTGAGLTGVGGATADARAAGGTDLGGTAHLLPIRGLPEDTRIGNRAWTASAEYRLPLAVLSASLRPLPVYLDRVALAAFADAGHAWCDDLARQRFGDLCAGSDPATAPLITAGGEITTFLSVYGAGLPLRIGAGVPLRGTTDRRFRGYVVTGVSF